MGVADDDVFHLARIEAELLQAADDGLLRRIVVQRVDQDDAVAGGQRPGRMNLGADEIEVVEHLGGIGVPGARAGGGGGRDVAARARSAARRRCAPACRRNRTPRPPSPAPDGRRSHWPAGRAPAPHPRRDNARPSKMTDFMVAFLIRILLRPPWRPRRAGLKSRGCHRSRPRMLPGFRPTECCPAPAWSRAPDRWPGRRRRRGSRGR